MKDFETKNEVQSQFKSKIIEILDYIKDFSSYDIFSYFYFDYKVSFGQKEETRDSRWLKSQKIMYLQILFSCINDKKCKNKKIENKDFNKIDRLIKELDIITVKYNFIKNTDRELTHEEEYMIHSDAFSGCNGKRYDVFEVQHHKDLLQSWSKEFKETYNFTLKELYNGITNLKNSFYFEFEDCINNLRDLIKKEKIEINEDGALNIPKCFDKKKNKKLDEYCNKVYTIELANIQKNTKWTIEFLNKFIIEKRQYENFMQNITIENWNRLVNRIKYKPIIKIDDNYYLLLQQSFYDNLDRIVIQGICENLNKKQEETLRHKYTSNIEIIVAKYFQNILNINQINIKNYYDFNKKILENDILIEYDNNIFIIEVKAGTFTPELATDDIESHKNSLHDLIKVANEQQDSFEKCLIQKKKVIIYDGNNKKTRKKKTEIKINEDTNIFKIIITAEAFNDIEARIDKVKMLSLSPNTLVFCLDDLRVYSEYFKQHPCYFIQYLLQRRKAVGNKNIDLVDELYHLGMWIEYNYYNEHINQRIEEFSDEQKIKGEIKNVLLCGEDWMIDLDAYYNNLWFKKSNVEKPFRKNPLEIEKIIGFCEKNNKSKNYSYFTTSLLNLNQDILEQIERIIIQSREFYNKNNRPKYRIYVVKRKR